MKRDPIVLGHSYILSGEDIGVTRPNANALIVGTTGCGKSTSVILPTMGRLRNSNPVLSYAKEADAYAMARYLKSKGYRVRILNIARPDKSTVSFDPTLSVESYEDIDALSASIVNATIKKSVDDYWNAKARPLLSSLIAGTFMAAGENQMPGMADVLELFDRLVLPSWTPFLSGWGKCRPAVMRCGSITHGTRFRTGRRRAYEIRLRPL